MLDEPGGKLWTNIELVSPKVMGNEFSVDGKTGESPLPQTIFSSCLVGGSDLGSVVSPTYGS